MRNTRAQEETYSVIHRSASKWYKKKTIKKKKHQLQNNRSSQPTETNLAVSQCISDHPNMLPRTSFDPLPPFPRVHDRQVQWVTHPRLDKPGLRGDGRIAPPVMVPQLRTEQRSQRAATRRRIMHPLPETRLHQPSDGWMGKTLVRSCRTALF